MLDRHLGEIKAVRRLIEEISLKNSPIHSAPYGAAPCGREYENHEIDKMLAMDVIEQSQTKWGSPVVFVPNKDGTLRFCMYQHKHDAVTIWDSYPYLAWTNVLALLMMPRYPLSWTLIAAIGK